MEGINLRAYAQKDPLFEYKKESYEMFHELEATIRKQVIRDLFHLVIEKAEQQQDDTKDLIYTTAGNSGDGKGIKRQPVKKSVKVGRNDPCPCGSGKKYKTCCWPKYGE
jgi:preprotein translocase subunit SecA